MQDQLREAQLELAAQRAQAALPPSPQLEHIMDKQTQILEAALKDRGSKRNTAGVIQINPKVTWPMLGDDGPGGREVEEFYDWYEEICGIARDGEV